MLRRFAAQKGRRVRTDLDREREEQRRWRLRPQFAGLQDTYDTLLSNEFLPEEELRARQAAALRQTIRHAVANVPYYRELFAARGLRPGDIRGPADLAKLPILEKQGLRSAADRLQAESLPRGEQDFGYAGSSGTTGVPSRVLHSQRSNSMFTLLTQRNYRWFRLDPSRTIAFIRTANDLPRRDKGDFLRDGETVRWPRWRYCGRHFETGPWYGLTLTTPIDQQLAWLQRVAPSYLAAHSSWLDQLTYATGGRPPAAGIEALIGLVEQVTEPMQARIERVFGAPLNQTYGMNEIGLVAARCPAGRFHVHAEHCLVEVVDAEGAPCPPGRPGRLVVTALSNAAMPLIRYDVDDRATLAAGPCPCGRNLPAFVDLIGRYRNYAALPEGSYALFKALQEAVKAVPDPLVRDLRQFQVHQHRDGRMELRLAVVRPLPAAAHAQVRAAWDRAIGTRSETLVITELDRIPRGPNGKYQDFTSDYAPPPGTPAG